MGWRGGAGLAVALAVHGAASTGHAQDAARPDETIEAAPGAAPAIGAGPYRYQLTLRDHQGQAKPGLPFALSLKAGGLPFVPEAKGVWRGVTDEAGRTPVFALSDKITAEDVFLRLRLGDGPLGEQMRLVSHVDNQPLAVFYRLVLCTTPPQQFVGQSDSDGFTAYAASSAPAHVLVFATGDDAIFEGRDGKLFWTDQAEAGVQPLTLGKAWARARQLRANRKACRKA